MDEIRREGGDRPEEYEAVLNQISRPKIKKERETDRCPKPAGDLYGREKDGPEGGGVKLFNRGDRWGGGGLFRITPPMVRGLSLKKSV